MQSIKRLCLLLIFTLFATGTIIAGQVLAADWYDPDWNYRKMITIDSTKVPNTDQPNFPVLINTTDVDWRDTVNGGQVAQSNGGDILFTDSDGTTKLSHEIESYNPATGEFTAWVQVPNVSSSLDTVIYMYYGNPGAADQWNVNGTWDSDFAGVWHLKEEQAGTGSLDLYQDSSSNSNDGDDYVSATGQNGQINGGQEFDGVDDYVSTPSVELANRSFTIEAWVKPSTSPPSQQCWFEAHKSFVATGGESIHLRIYNSGRIRFGYYWDDLDTVAGVVQFGEWNHIVVSYDNDTDVSRIYYNGVLNVSGNQGPFVGASPVIISIGKWATQYFNGTVDEVRISNIARSPDWIRTSFNNQSSPSTFYTVGSEEALPDLIVSYLSIPKVRKNRRGHIARVFVDYRVMNQGDGDAVASELDFYLSGDTVLDGSDTYVGTVNIPALASGEETHRLLNAKKFKLSRPVFSSGTWYVLGAADAGDDNVESDETNNVTAVLVTGSGR